MGSLLCRFLLHFVAIIACSVPGWGTALARTSTLPNIVVIMADDIGLGDISASHDERFESPSLVSTPHLDRLIKEGMRFTDAHSPASLCAPTRFSMMTGNFSYRNRSPWGVWSPEADALIDPKYTTVARIAKAGGYHTAFFGKWGLGGVWNGIPEDYSIMDAGATHYGFDYAVELPQGIQNQPYAFYENGRFMPLYPDSKLVEISLKQTGYKNIERWRNYGGIGDSNWDPVQAGPTLIRKAVDYIENQVADHPNEPFYMYYCSQAVHVPHQPPVSLDGKKIAGTTPGAHGDMIHELDTQVGMIIGALKRTGVYEDTLFIFTSDNGGLVVDKDMVNAGHLTSNGFRGSKASIYEGGHRVPFIAVWHGIIEPGSVSHVPIVSHDTVATIAAIAGQKVDRDVIRDSANLLPYLTGTTSKPAHKSIVHRASNGPTFALRRGDWKLIMQLETVGLAKNWYQQNYNGTIGPVVPIALFDLHDNPFEDEKRNLVNSPEQAHRIKEMLSAYRYLRNGGEPTVAD